MRSNLSTCCKVEPLEPRQLFAAPRATSIVTDNRGDIQITFDSALDAATVKTTNVQVHTAGADDVFGTADDVKITGRVKLKTGNRRIWWRPAVAVPFIAGTTYSVKVSGKNVKSALGERIDGEFNGPGIVSGNGTAGGDLLFLSKRAKTDLVARFTTVMGNIDVSLFTDQKPLTTGNFFHYANNGLWDYTVVHRNAHNLDSSPFVIQGGGFNASLTDNTVNGLGVVPTTNPVNNEPGISNTRGTIAMAKLPATDGQGNPVPGGGPNSATSQWFFNEQDNGGTSPNGLDFQNGGFTVFGEIRNASGLAVMDSIGALQNANLQGGNVNDPNNPTLAMDDAPVLRSGVTHDNVQPLSDMVIVSRIAILNKYVAFPIPT